MIWYKDLYVGESIVHKTKKVKWKIMHNAGQIGIYVITLASNTQNLLDIIPSYELMQKGYPKKIWWLWDWQRAMMKRLRSQHPLWMKCTTVPAHLPSAPILQKNRGKERRMSVILLILKIIGWILLTLPALFLLIVFLVLVVPVRYRTDGSIEENIRVQGKVHWLLHILSFGFSYNEEGFSYTLKLFGKRIALGEKLEDEEEEPDADSTDTAVHETKAEVENILPSDSKMQRQDVSVKDAAEANEKKDSKDGTDTKEQTSIVRKNIDETDSEKVSFGQRITSKFHDITNKIKGIRGKLADLSGQAGKIKAALTDEHNRNSVSAIWKELKYLLKHSRFRKIDTELNFALWEPSATGQALGILAMFPAIYQYDIGIYPDFEADKTYVKGTFLVKGHIRLVHVLISGIRLLKERDIRNFIKKFFK